MIYHAFRVCAAAGNDPGKRFTFRRQTYLVNYNGGSVVVVLLDKSPGHVVRIGKRFEFSHTLKIFNISGLILFPPDVTNILNVFPICKFSDHIFAKIYIPYIIYRAAADCSKSRIFL